MNAQQAGAVDECATTGQVENGITIVDGPPGSGKTTVSALAALQYLRHRRQNLRPHHVVILSYTNTSADRCLESLQELGVTSEMALRVMSREGRTPQGADAEFYLSFQSESDLTHAELQRLRSAKILLSTTYAANRALRQTRRPLLVLDEISQISMGTFLGLLAEGKSSGRDLERIVLVGDPAQLPVVTSQRTLETNAASFIRSQTPTLRPHQLELQYRMHPTICAVVNQARTQMNTYPLETGQVAMNRTLDSTYARDTNVDDTSPWMVPLTEPLFPVVAVNTDGLPNEDRDTGGSWRYDEEAQAAAGIARFLERSYPRLRSGQGPGLQPVLLSPYRLQRETMQSHVPHLRCLSIHESQGREYDCVILSLTRKNIRREVGFLGELWPLSYVGLSRARCKLIVLFSFDTFRDSAFPQRIIDFLLQDEGVARIDAINEMRTWMP